MHRTFAEPSQADALITRRLRDALQLVGITVLDHLIVAGGEVLSFAEKGLLRVRGGFGPPFSLRGTPRRAAISLTRDAQPSGKAAACTVNRSSVRAGPRCHPIAHGEKEVVVRKLIERIETPRGEKLGYIRLKSTIVAQHGDCAEKRWFHSASDAPIANSARNGLLARDRCRELRCPGR